MSLPEALENAASALPDAADAIRDANGDASALLQHLDAQASRELAGWMLTHEPAACDELLAEWSRQEEGALAIASVDAQALPKNGRKALRRVLHALRSRGVELPSAPAPGPRVSRLPEIEEAVGGAWALPIDPRGARVVFLIDPQPGRTSRIYETVVDGVRGIVEFAETEASRSRVRRFVKELSRRTRGGAQPIEPAEARALIARAAARQPADRPAPKAFVDRLPRLGLDAGADTTPGDRARATLGDEEGEPSRERLNTIEKLARMGAVGPWPPSLEQLREQAERFKELVEGRVIVSGATQRERVHAALLQVAESFYDESFAEITAERFREVAYIFWSTDREEEARASLAAARAFETLPVADNPVALAFVEQLLKPAIAQLEAEEGSGDASADAGSEDGDGDSDGKSSLLVTP